MNTKILDILCEGQTEEAFVRSVLKPYLQAWGIVVKSRLLCTSKQEKIYGGIIDYQQVARDLGAWAREVGRRNGETHYFTTMIDLYALPNDFPGYADASKIMDAYIKVAHLERCFKMEVPIPRFIPYIQLHEFEALLFCDITRLCELYPQCEREINHLPTVLEHYQGNPELINTTRENAPSKWIIRAVEARHKANYKKPRSAEYVTKSIGIPSLMVQCRHFREWIERLSAL